MLRNTLILGFVLALTFGVFVRTTDHAFIIWDDDKNIYENPHLSQFSLDGIAEFWKRPFQGLYIPVTYTVWAVLAYSDDLKVNPGAGPNPMFNPFRFHLTNIVLHLGSVCLVTTLFFLLLERKDFFAAAVGAAFFALHPLQVESVAWVTGLKDTLSTFLALVTILLYLRFSKLLKDQRGALAWTFCSLAFLVYVIALLSKPQLVIIPPIIAILIWCRDGPQFIYRINAWVWDGLFLAGLLGPIAYRSVLAIFKQEVSLGMEISLTAVVVASIIGLWMRRKKIGAFPHILMLSPFMIAAFAFVHITLISQPDQDSIFPFTPPTILQRPIVALDAIAFYLSKLFYPFQLTIDYGRRPEKALELAANYPVWIVPVVLGALMFRIREHRRYYYAAFAIAFVGVLPVLGLITFGFQGQSTVADRYVYIAMIGVGFAVATFLTYTGSALPRYACFCLLPVLAFISYAQAGHWKNSEVLFQYALKVNPRSVASTYNLGLTYSNEGFLDRALNYYHRAIKLKDDFSNPWNNIGYILNKRKQHKEALPYLEQATKVNIDYPGAYSNLGIAYDGLGEYEKAIAAYNKALERRPIYPEVFINLGLVYLHQKDYDHALIYFKKASNLRPQWRQPYNAMGNTYMETKNYVLAIANFQNLANIEPDHPQNWRSLGRAFALNGQFDQAARMATTAIEKAKGFPGFNSGSINQLQKEYAAYAAGRVEPEPDPDPDPKPEPAPEPVKEAPGANGAGADTVPDSAAGPSANAAAPGHDAL